MHIIDYLKKYKLRVVEFASMMKVTTFSVYRWCEGKRPRDSKIKNIKELTDGEITENDWGMHSSRCKKASNMQAGGKPIRHRATTSLEGDKRQAAKVRDGYVATQSTSEVFRIYKGDDT